ncbi:unnamed protein product [Pleuronectes platessa]|uniref:Uncharacterized protein n=1 Tax=Pleuronectes platessa TaxID=8262 RepID=A0A9N7TWA5_PLEPL|nr:unnamed protein product [Pleuronectes platessa]
MAGLAQVLGGSSETPQWEMRRSTCEPIQTPADRGDRRETRRRNTGAHSPSPPRSQRLIVSASGSSGQVRKCSPDFASQSIIFTEAFVKGPLIELDMTDGFSCRGLAGVGGRDQMGRGPYLDSFGPNGVAFPHGSYFWILIGHLRSERATPSEGSESDASHRGASTSDEGVSQRTVGMHSTCLWSTGHHPTLSLLSLNRLKTEDVVSGRTLVRRLPCRSCFSESTFKAHVEKNCVKFNHIQLNKLQ